MIELDIAPMPAPRLNRYSRFHPKKQRLQQRYERWKADVRKLALVAGWRPTEELHVIFVIPMPISWSAKKKREMTTQPHQRRKEGDRNNLMKALEDALYEEDSYVWKSSEEKRWGYDGKILILQEGR